MAEAEGTKRRVPPYLPYRTFSTYLDGLRVFVPQVIDRDSMRTFSGSMQSWLMTALRYLNMIDDGGHPRPRLEQIAGASAEERRPMLRQLIQAEYAFLKDIDLGRATPRQLDAAFEQAGAQGDTVRKAVAFFLSMAKDAELPLSPLLLKAQRRSPNRSAGGRKNTNQINGGNSQVADVATPPVVPSVTKTPLTPEQQLLDILDTSVMSVQEQDAVWTLLKYLKKKGREVQN